MILFAWSVWRALEGTFTRASVASFNTPIVPRRIVGVDLSRPYIVARPAEDGETL